MRIKVERSGGFTGINLTNSVSTDQMSAEEAKKISDLVGTARFFELPSVIRSNPPEPDRPQYKITVETERGTHTVQVDQAAMPAQLQPVLNWMKSSERAQLGK
jgi:hypothetical protein